MTELPWLNTAKKLVGTKEIPGLKSNKEITQWAKLLGLDTLYTTDDIPWCGLFVAYCLAENGIEPVVDPLWALNWAKFGERVAPAYGTILAFSRNGGGHVGFYISEDQGAYHVLGGNQSDMVSIARVAKSQFVAATWPSEYIGLYTTRNIIATLSIPVISNASMT